MGASTYEDDRLRLKNIIITRAGIDIESPSYQKHYFYKEFERIFSKKNYDEYKDQLFYFFYFLTQLEKIKNYNKKNFDEYLKKLSTDGLNINGEQFEILTYARLIDENISFSKPKNNPDFEFTINNNSIFIECGTRQAKKKGCFIESVEQSIINKNTKKYSNRNTALHIDLSKSKYNSVGEKDFLDKEALKKILDEIISTVNFGAIVLISNFYAKEDGIVYGQPIIKYNEDCNNELKTLHNLMFKLENRIVTPILKPFL